MNFNINIQDMFQALQNLTLSMAGTKLVGTNTIEHSYIVPTIIGEYYFSLSIFFVNNKCFFDL